MKDFSVLWTGDHLSVISPEDQPYEAIHEQDAVHVLPIDVQTSELIIRREVCPPYTVRDSQEHPDFQTIVSGGIEDGESAEEAVKREVAEELGIDLEKAEYEIIAMTPPSIPFMKATVSRVSLFALMLFSYEINEPEGDGSSYEDMSTFEFVPLQQIDKVLLSDQADLLLHAAVAKLKCFLLLEES